MNDFPYLTNHKENKNYVKKAPCLHPRGIQKYYGFPKLENGKFGKKRVHIGYICPICNLYQSKEQVLNEINKMKNERQKKANKDIR
ncbi:MAG TPA: hypothetical protein VMZ91_03565 [Candidatus Paceibacterota bacterium]|nr:hypothetical protein [Candidatus Paceibacterota bacterium]